MNLRQGLSLAEALVVLVISSLVLSTLLPIASRAIADNTRVGLRGLGEQDRSIDEDVFRRLVSAATLPSRIPGQIDPEQSIRGTSDTLSFLVLPRSGLACAPARGMSQVTLSIRRTRTDVEISCANEDRSVTWLTVSNASAGFAYSADGAVWRENWPQAGLGASGLADVVAEDELQPGTPTALPPLVRLTITPERGKPIVWVARTARPQVVREEYPDIDEGSAP